MQSAETVAEVGVKEGNSSGPSADPKIGFAVLRHHSIIRAGHRAPLDLKELWEFRDLLFALAGRDLKLRYKQTFLGIVWVVLQPLLAAGIFSFVFGKVARMPSDGVPYFLFSYAGLLGWNFFNNTVTKVAASLISNSQILTKVYFNRLILPLSNISSAFVDFGVAAAVLLMMMAASRVSPSLEILTLPLWTLALLWLGLGMGLLACSLSVTYRDIQYILPVFLQLLLYATPVAYSVSAIPAQFRTLYYLNPLSAPLEAFRSAILGTSMPGLGTLAYSLSFAIGIQILGLLAFKRFERNFADVI